MERKAFLCTIPVACMLLLAACGSGSQKYFFSAANLQSHPTPEQVIAFMGQQPDTSFTREYFGNKRFIQVYKKEDSTEFRFKDGVLIEAVVNKPTLPYTPESITAFGLPFEEPTSQDSTAFFMWKKKYEGFDVVNFYLTGSRRDGREKTYSIYFKLAD